MQDARPQQSLCYEMDIKITGSDTSTPKKYSWVEVYRDSSGIWNELKRSGSFTLDPAYEVNNAAVVTGMICPARRDQRTGNLIFATRSSGASTPSPASCPIKLLASFEYLGVGDACTANWVWSSPKDPVTGEYIPTPQNINVGWGVGKVANGKFGLASFDWIEFQYMKLHETTWNTAKRLIPGTDPDPRITPYSWNPPVYPVRIRVVSQLNSLKVAHATSSGFSGTPDWQGYVYATAISSPQTQDLNPDGSPNQIWVYFKDVGSIQNLKGSCNVDQPQHSTTTMPSSCTVAFSNVQLEAPNTASGAVKAAIATMNVTMTGTLVGSPYESLGLYFNNAGALVSWTGIATNTASVSGTTGNTGTISSWAGKCPGQTPPSQSDGTILQAARVRVGLNVDDYGIGNYLDLRYSLASISAGVKVGGASFPYTPPAALISSTIQLYATWVPGRGWNAGGIGLGTPSVDPPQGFSKSLRDATYEANYFGGPVYNAYTFTATFSFS